MGGDGKHYDFLRRDEWHKEAQFRNVELRRAPGHFPKSLEWSIDEAPQLIEPVHHDVTGRRKLLEQWTVASLMPTASCDRSIGFTLTVENTFITLRSISNKGNTGRNTQGRRGAWTECEAAAYWCLRSAKGNAVHDAGVDDAAT